MIYLHALDACCLKVENIYVILAQRWLPLCSRLWLTHLRDLKEESWGSVFSMAASTCEALRVNELTKLLVASSESKIRATLLAITHKDSIGHRTL